VFIRRFKTRQQLFSKFDAPLSVTHRHDAPQSAIDRHKATSCFTAASTAKNRVYMYHASASDAPAITPERKRNGKKKYEV